MVQYYSERIGATTDLTDVQKIVINTLHKEGKPQEVIVKEAGSSEYCFQAFSQKDEWKEKRW